MALIDNIKSELRVSGTDFDIEIQGLIDAAKTDLTQSGVRKVVDTDYLTKIAIVLYCKGNFGFDNQEADRFISEYEKIRAKLAVASDYNAYKITFTVTRSAVAVKDAEITINNETYYTNSQGVYVYYSYDKEIDIDYAVNCLGSIVTGSVYVDNDESVAVSI